MRRALTVALLVLAAISAQGQTVIGVHLASAHDKPGFNNTNPGLYIKQLDADGNGPVAGGYFNSERKDSFYAAYSWRLASVGGCTTELTAGLITGYEIAPVAPFASPSAACVITSRLSARLHFVPLIKKDGASVLHLSLEYSL